ncbi:hypothetical protein D1AOALGA4SA_5767 [Olavius algarvensis Delta 1 endosymbiont]|nr:hypothetical protein D1AOALGA4SA_5767 [Olavius algarvensis Delta 1 endosymbiont]
MFSSAYGIEIAGGGTTSKFITKIVNYVKLFNFFRQKGIMISR